MSCFGGSSKEYFCGIKLLDDTELNHDIQKTTKGQVLLDKVFQHLNILETDYFGLRYLDEASQTHWLDGTRSVTKQITAGPPYTLYFGVKFYIEDPCKLKEEVTRYQFFLQLKRDMLQGRLPSSPNITSELCALAVQSELGDCDAKRHSHGYISEFRFVPNQTKELEHQIEQIHQTLKGQVPATAEMSFLERAKLLEMYGVDLHPVKGQDNVDYFLGLTPTGVVIYKSKNKVANYFWPRITKVHFKDFQFILRVIGRDNTENEYYFELPNKSACKHLWKCCVEQHAFFRLPHVMDAPSDKLRRYNFGSSRFRHSGRTQLEALQASEHLKRPQPKVVRLPSKRYMRRASAQMDSSGAPIISQWAPYQDNLILENGVAKTVAPEPVKSGMKMASQERQSSSKITEGSANNNKSVPWEGSTNSKPRGLYTPAGGSPVSVRSTGSSGRRRSRSKSPKHHHHHHHHHHRRSSGSDWDSDSSCRKHRRHRHRSGSDTDSDYCHHRKRRSRSRGGASSGSESDNSRHSHKSRRRRRRSSDRMVESEEQWRQVQRQQQALEEERLAPHSAIIKDLRNGRSLEDRRASSELKKHIQYELVEPPGATEEEMRFIPYTAIETEGVPVRVKTTPTHRRRRSRSGERSRSNSKQRDSDGEHSNCSYTDRKERHHRRSGSDSSRRSSRRRSQGGNESPPVVCSRESTPKTKHRSRHEKRRSSYEKENKFERGMFSGGQSSSSRRSDESMATVLQVSPNAKPLYITAVYQSVEPSNTLTYQPNARVHQHANAPTFHGVGVQHSREDSGISNDGQESQPSPKNYILLPVTMEARRPRSDFRPVGYTPIDNGQIQTEHQDTNHVTQDTFPFRTNSQPQRSEVNTVGHNSRARRRTDNSHLKRPHLAQNLSSSFINAKTFESKYIHAANEAVRIPEKRTIVSSKYVSANQNNSNVNLMSDMYDGRANYLPPEDLQRGQLVLEYLAAQEEVSNASSHTPSSNDEPSHGPTLPGPPPYQEPSSVPALPGPPPYQEPTSVPALPGPPPYQEKAETRRKKRSSLRTTTARPWELLSDEDDDITAEEIRIISSSPSYHHELSTEL
ncbi:band 4.1-like protein 4 isoform X2 [Ptychodera flava]|uniref:band 4.1-like protein 4 isoform X2 n=1 Tax=Ptychodera flava TaxID=63121 RepID=UPI00396AA284